MRSTPTTAPRRDATRRRVFPKDAPARTQGPLWLTIAAGTTTRLGAFGPGFARLSYEKKEANVMSDIAAGVLGQFRAPFRARTRRWTAAWAV